MRLLPYTEQRARWPRTGRVILAQFDARSIVVYQAYRPSIGHFAAENGYFGGDDFKLDRMTWIKPNFLWMMYRSGWGRRTDQEVTLAVRILRSAFDGLLRRAVHSSFRPKVYEDRQAWKARLEESDVRLQWDPDHDPSGARLERRALQLGLRGDAVRSYARDWVVEVSDISDLVAEQREHVVSGRLSQLKTPAEEVYPVPADVREHLELDDPEEPAR